MGRPQRSTTKVEFPILVSLSHNSVTVRVSTCQLCCVESLKFISRAFQIFCSETDFEVCFASLSFSWSPSSSHTNFHDWLQGIVIHNLCSPLPLPQPKQNVSTLLFLTTGKVFVSSNVAPFFYMPIYCLIKDH